MCVWVSGAFYSLCSFFPFCDVLLYMVFSKTRPCASVSDEMMPPIVSDVQLCENKECVRYRPGTAWLGEWGSVDAGAWRSYLKHTT